LLEPLLPWIQPALSAIRNIDERNPIDISSSKFKVKTIKSTIPQAQCIPNRLSSNVRTFYRRKADKYNTDKFICHQQSAEAVANIFQEPTSPLTEYYLKNIVYKTLLYTHSDNLQNILRNICCTSLKLFIQL
jgi:hypothetical protein